MAGIGAAALLRSGSGRAQAPSPYRIGVLTSAWGPTGHVAGMIRRLTELGHAEGESFVVAIWFTEGRSGGLAAMAAEMVATGVDIIVPVGPLETEVALGAAPGLPIVFVDVADPIGQGLIASYRRPGGTVTGVTDGGYGLGAQRLRLLSEIAPGFRRVLYPYDAANRHQKAEGAAYRTAAAALGLTFIERPFNSIEEAAALTTLTRDDVDWLLAPRQVGCNIPGFILDATASRGIPSMFDMGIYPADGGFSSYGAALDAVGYRAAAMIDEIIRGVDTSEIPAETVPEIEFVINLRVAADLGIAVPPMLLFQADRILR